jgi:2-C-methyl-D-erythritol 4-phosphate cytidylyltransferase
MNVAIVPAGGTGTRFGATKPKQFLEINGVPIIIRALRHIAACQEISEIVVALPEASLPEFETLRRRFPLACRCRTVIGGLERQDSVRLALESCPPEVEYVAVHDAVRPFILPELVAATLAAAREFRAAVVGHPATDTIKIVRDGLAIETPPRETLYAVQTPQAFEARLLRDAHARAVREGWRATDDAMLAERLGTPVRIVPGPPWNLKITHPGDLALAEVILAQRAS